MSALVVNHIEGMIKQQNACTDRFGLDNTGIVQYQFNQLLKEMLAIK